MLKIQVSYGVDAETIQHGYLNIMVCPATDKAHHFSEFQVNAFVELDTHIHICVLHS